MFAEAVSTGFAEWYGSPGSHQPINGSDETNKWELTTSMATLLKSECDMVPTKEAKEKSNRYQVVSSDMTKAKWTEFCQKATKNSGTNRAAFYVKTVNHKYTGVAGIVYLSKDGNYVVRIIFKLGINGCDFTEDDIGVFVQKLPLES